MAKQKVEPSKQTNGGGKKPISSSNAPGTTPHPLPRFALLHEESSQRTESSPGWAQSMSEAESGSFGSSYV